MTPLAIIFDVYGTLLEVGPAPAAADAAWVRLWSEALDAAPQFSRLEFAIACDNIIRQRHERARGRGIAYPEIDWPSVVAEAVPGLGGRPAETLTKFSSGFMSLSRTISLTQATADFLRWISGQGALLGIASNAQAYTLDELGDALRQYQLDLGLFEPDLCFWSYRHGFSKPDPHVFQILSARLESLGVAPGASWMVGDRLDNDIEPARLQGWQTWLYGREKERGWDALQSHLTRS